MWNAIKETLNIFRAPTPIEMAAKELADAERALLEASTAREYATAMVDYNNERIYRLRKYLKEAGNED